MIKRLTMGAMIPLLIAISSNSYALTEIVAKVVKVQASTMPGAITFILDTGNATCPAGAWVTWQKTDPENNKAVYALLLAASQSGHQIEFFHNDGDTTCMGQFIVVRNS